MTSPITVKKRNGSIEPVDLEKMHKMVEEACENLAGVSPSQVEMATGIQFYDGISTAEIQKILIKSASHLITTDNPNYQYVAGRLLLFSLRKSLYGRMRELPTLQEHLRITEKLYSIYDPVALGKYSEEEILKINDFIDHDRDFIFTYAGLQQLVDKYLVQDRSTGKVYETPQFMYVLIAMCIFADYPAETRLNYVQRYYDAISKHRLSLPTPVMGGVRTKLRQFASCVLVDVDDTLDSIGYSDLAILRYVAQRAGIGINLGRIRSIGSKIRGGEVNHTGVVPFLKKYESTVRSCTQNGIRGGSATVHFPIWHAEIEDILVLKNNKGTEDNRVRKLDYSIQLSKLFYERFIKNEDITLFSPRDVPGLYEAFGMPEFDEMYKRYERNSLIPKKQIASHELLLALVKERADTGRIYVMNIDHVNSHSSFLDKVSMSNLCQEITLPTTPLADNLSEGEIALCILSAFNIGKLKNLDDLEELADLAVRSLDELIDYQDYPLKAAENSTKSRRSLGIGFMGVAHYLAKLGYKYESPEACEAMHRLAEAHQYYLLKASNRLAQEKGPCEAFRRTKYCQGVLPIDTYKKEVDGICNVPLAYDWEELRDSINVYGLRNSTLSAQMPGESSSVVSNSTNGIEPPRGYLSIKKSKHTPLRQLVPQYQSLKNNYTLLWDMKSNEGYINIVAVMQKFFDQGISGNWSYNPENYPNNEVPISHMVGDLLQTYKLGWKTSYYHNTYDMKADPTEEDGVKAEGDTPQNCILDRLDEECESCAI